MVTFSRSLTAERNDTTKIINPFVFDIARVGDRLQSLHCGLCRTTLCPRVGGYRDPESFRAPQETS
jgi:hypothetical protein